MQEKYDENLKIAVILRTIRGILGMSQTKFAEYMGLPKSTVARAESLILPMKVDVYFKILKKLKEQGIEVDPFSEEPTFKITKQFLEAEQEQVKKQK